MNELQKSKEAWAKFEAHMKLVDAELAAIENAHKHAQRLRNTPPVDEDFPEVKFEYDRAVRELVAALRANQRA